MTWTSINRHNEILDIDDNHYISYLHKDNQREFTKTWGAVDGTDETALITKVPWLCLILNGNHRKAYEELVDQGYTACYNYFLSHPELKSSWSEG
jgi:hypothetical protein